VPVFRVMVPACAVDPAARENVAPAPTPVGLRMIAGGVVLVVGARPAFVQ
jgi:hypothetical protein